jgi:uncharacterized protein YjbJ (UPF0337 family)
MKDSTQNKIEGNAKQAAGKVKETTGRIVNNENLEAKGIADQAEGKVQKKVGQVQDVVEE